MGDVDDGLGQLVRRRDHCALAWKARCAVIMLTSCVVRSTFELSRAPDWMVPKPAEPAVPCTTVPDVKVCGPVGIAQLLQALRVGEVRHRQLAQLRGAAVGVDRRDDAGGVDGDGAELAGRIAVLGDRGDAEARRRTAWTGRSRTSCSIGAAPSVGREAAEAQHAARRRRDRAGVREVKVCAAPTAVPLMVMLTVH